MRMLVMIVLLLAVALVALLATRPDRFHVERSATIDAPSSTVFSHIDDFHRWTAWSPWEKIDPQLQRSYDGPHSGVGAGYRWSGSSQVGEGSMRITESIPDRKVGIALEFIKPFRASNVATFTLAPEGPGTRVTWAMDGTNSWLAKLIGLFMSMDRMVGTEFEKGLATLKQVCESTPPVPPA